MDYLNKKIGIIGGGQLGKMMILEAKKLGFHITILDPVEDCPAHSIADKHIVANFDDREAIIKLASETDVITYEFEHINHSVLIELENNAKKIYPTAKSLAVIQDKLMQKKALKNENLPVPKFMEVETKEDILKLCSKFGYPMILKSRTNGYDGKGNHVIKSNADIDEAFEKLGNGKYLLMLEEFIPFTKEISVLACRSISGEVAIYPVAENNHVDSILNKTVVPAYISKAISDKAMFLAKRVMEVFEGVGMFCVEMFVCENQDILINEVAPRPHNSGHYTIEGCVTSQFEQHIRAISGLPLGNPNLIRPSVMINILGEENFNGKAYVEGLQEALNIKNVKVHIYGKRNTSPKRKMGHLTVTAETIEEAEELAEKAKNLIKVIS